MESFPECGICINFVAHGDRNQYGGVVVSQARCECKKHAVELPQMGAKYSICLDYENDVTGERAKEWAYQAPPKDFLRKWLYVLSSVRQGVSQVEGIGQKIMAVFVTIKCCLEGISLWRDFECLPFHEEILYSYDSGYNFNESLKPVCPLNALPKWVDNTEN